MIYLEPYTQTNPESGEETTLHRVLGPNEELTENTIPVFVSFFRGMLKAHLRAPNKETFYQQAEAVALVWRETEIEKDEEGNIVSETKVGPYIVPRGVTITEIGSVTLTPGEYDEEGNTIAEPEVDNRFHVNFWLNNRWVKEGSWMQWAMAWSIQGTDIQEINNMEDGKVFNAVELIDPDTISSPNNVLL